jgi:hypothetical protein
MRKILILISIVLCTFAQSQAQPSESHNFTTYDTTLSISTGPWSGPDQWNVRITRPAGMFTPGNPDTASRPVIIMMPGIGEQGNSNTSNLMVWGPHYWLNNGWDGSVVLGNGKHYPILITVSYINNMNPTAPAYYNLLMILLNTYHIKRNSVHTTGLSQGSFTNGARSGDRDVADQVHGPVRGNARPAARHFGELFARRRSLWRLGAEIWGEIFHPGGQRIRQFQE